MNSLHKNFSKLQNMVMDVGSETNLEDNHNIDHDIYLTSYDLFFLNQIKHMRLILPWFILTFGLVGNISILMIFLKKKLTSNGFCFLSLAISDSMALMFMLLRSMLKLQIVSNVSATCKIIKYIYHVSLQISSWCLVLLTIDRLIAVCFVFKYRSWCKKWHAVKVLIVFVVTIILANIHLLIFVSSSVFKDSNYMKPTTTSSTKKNYHHGIYYGKEAPIKVDGPIYTCNVDAIEHPIYYKYFYSQYDIYHALIYGIVPFIIILISNVLIILKLTVLKKKNFLKSTFNASVKSLDKLDSSFRSFQITLMLLSIAFLFLIFTSPISLYMAIFYDHLKSVRESKREYIKVILRYIGYFNNAINFYVYIIFSNEFRKEFVKTIRSCFRLKSITSVTSMCTTSTNLGSNNMLDKVNEMKPLKLSGKLDVKRSRLEFKRKNYEIPVDNQTSADQFSNPFNTRNYVDAVELFKHNTRNAKLNHYKRADDDLNSSMKPFISEQSTPV